MICDSGLLPVAGGERLKWKEGLKKGYSSGLTLR